MRQFIVLDLDGTICNIEHRQHLAAAKQWDEFHGLLEIDEPNLDVLGLIQNIAEVYDEAAYDFIICTGRPEKYRNQTVAWLTKHAIPVTALVMRSDNDFSKSGPMKTQMLEEYFGSKEKVIEAVAFALEDRDQIIEHFRNYGIRCWQVRPGGY